MAFVVQLILARGYILPYGDTIFNSLGYNQGSTLYYGAANGIVDHSLDRLDVAPTVQAGFNGSGGGGSVLYGQGDGITLRRSTFDEAGIAVPSPSSTTAM